MLRNFLICGLLPHVATETELPEDMLPVPPEVPATKTLPHDAEEMAGDGENFPHALLENYRDYRKHKKGYVCSAYNLGRRIVKLKRPGASHPPALGLSAVCRLLMVCLRRADDRPATHFCGCREESPNTARQHAA